MLVVFSRVLRDSTPRFVGPSIHPSIHPMMPQSLYFFSIYGVFFGACCSCPNAPLTTNMAPDHPQTTEVALYLALLVADWLLYKRPCPSISLSVSLCAQVKKLSIFCSPVCNWYWLCILFYFIFSGQNKSFYLQ